MTGRFLKFTAVSAALLCLTACGKSSEVTKTKASSQESTDLVSMEAEDVTKEIETEPTTEPFSLDVTMPKGHKIARKSVIKKFETVMQEPELPTGCEVTALCQTLNFLGFDIDKEELADEFMPLDTEGSTTMNHAYIGDPKFCDGFGCLPPVIVQTADDYFKSINSPCYAVDMSDKKLEELFYQIEEGRPLIVWATIDLWECPNELRWTTEDGEEMWFNGMQHCMTIYGYDLDKNIVYVADPLRGNMEYDLEQFERMYELLEEKAVVICGDSDTEGVYNPDKNYKRSKFLSRNEQERKKEEEERKQAEKERKEREKAEKEGREIVTEPPTEPPTRITAEPRRSEYISQYIPPVTEYVAELSEPVTEPPTEAVQPSETEAQPESQAETQPPYVPDTTPDVPPETAPQPVDTPETEEVPVD